MEKILSLFKKPNPLRKRKARKTAAQSMVEFAIALPVLILLLAGLVEFGFILNFYLSLLDATRDTARRYSSGEPFVRIPPTADGVMGLPTIDSDQFYNDAIDFAIRYLDPQIITPTYQGRRIPLDPAVDDVIVTVYAIKGNNVAQYPSTGPRHLNNLAPFASIFDTTSILNTRIANAPNEGLLLVEVHYHYHQVLALPYLTVFVPDPLQLHAYTIMPIRAAEPGN